MTWNIIKEAGKLTIYKWPETSRSWKINIQMTWNIKKLENQQYTNECQHSRAIDCTCFTSLFLQFRTDVFHKLTKLWIYQHGNHKNHKYLQCKSFPLQPKLLHRDLEVVNFIWILGFSAWYARTKHQKYYREIPHIRQNISKSW